MEFETLTMAPLQSELIDMEMMTPQEISFVNNYHSKVLSNVGPLLLEQGDKDAHDWLVRNTKPLMK